jgi:hypothetical protein
MRYRIGAGIVALLANCGLAVVCLAQQNPQKTYDWAQGNDETVRLDPGYYHTGSTYRPGLEGQKIQVEVEAEKPVTLAIVSTEDWSNASQRPETLGAIKFWCVQEHVLKTTYTCDLPPNDPKTLVVRDERRDFAGMGEVISGHDRDGRDRQISAGIGALFADDSPRQFFAPNNVRIQYFDWSCVENCNLPDPPHDIVFNWVPAQDMTLRLDPADFYTGNTYTPGPQGGNMRVDVEARRPVTVALAPADGWSQVTSPVNRRDIKTIDFICVQQHVTKANYACNMPGFWGQVLVIRDERPEERDAEHRDARNAANPVPVATAAPLTEHNAAGRGEFVSPNDVHIQYYSWRCVEYCDQPVFQWVNQVKEKYEVTNILKVYGGITPDHDGAQVSIKVKSPLPVAVAMLPSKTANQLYGKPDMFESAVEQSTCQQRGVQSSTFQCQFNVADGPQSLVIRPEPGVNIPAHKKIEVEAQAVKCIENCKTPPASN